MTGRDENTKTRKDKKSNSEKKGYKKGRKTKK
jgi:hypothetical protein